MQVLLALALAGSTARAGLRLGLSHQTVARRLTRLEARLGALLVDRGQTAWRLTPLGETVAGQARQMAGIMGGTLALTRPEMAGLRGRVSISAPRWTVATSVLPALAALRPRHPGLQFDLLSEGNAADLALIAAPVMPPGPSARRISTLGASLYGTPAAIARMESALASGGASDHEAFAHARPHLISLDPHGNGDNMTQVGDTDTLSEAVRLGLGVAVLPDTVGRTLPGVVPCALIALPRGTLALWCVSDPDSPRVAHVRLIEREIFRAARTHEHRTAV
ncbi:LysR family transcriptional regulator [Seohaeicola zhoushanensis]|nr:LysR family transcriptional regulator [Seohaeicola zhoushanensis]